MPNNHEVVLYDISLRSERLVVEHYTGGDINALPIPELYRAVRELLTECFKFVPPNDIRRETTHLRHRKNELLGVTILPRATRVFKSDGKRRDERRHDGAR